MEAKSKNAIRMTLMHDWEIVVTSIVGKPRMERRRQTEGEERVSTV